MDDAVEPNTVTHTTRGGEQLTAGESPELETAESPRGGTTAARDEGPSTSVGSASDVEERQATKRPRCDAASEPEAPVEGVDVEEEQQQWEGEEDLYESAEPWVAEPSTPRSNVSEADELGYSPTKSAYHAVEEAKLGHADGEEETSDPTETGTGMEATVGVEPNQLGPTTASTKIQWVDRYNIEEREALYWRVDHIMDGYDDSDYETSTKTPYMSFLHQLSQTIDEWNLVRRSRAWTRLPKPLLSMRRLTEMAFCIEAISGRRDYRSVILRHFGDRPGDSTSFGACAGPYCCLHQEFTEHGALGVSICRHWELYARCQVYADRFASLADYRLTQALACVVQAHESVQAVRENQLEEKPSASTGGALEISSDVKAIGPPSELFQNYHRAKIRPYAKALLETMTVIVPGASHYGNRTNQFNDAMRPGQHGTLRRNRHSEEDYHAILLKYDGLLFWLVIVSPSDASEWDAVYWEAHGSMLGHARRCAAIEQSADAPLVTKMYQRDATCRPKHPSVIRLIQNGHSYQHYKAQLDPAQGRALDYATLTQGLLLIRGPFGCGKTHLIAAIVAVLYEACPTSRIFITSETNTAIDEDLRRLVAEGRVPAGRIVRLGTMEQEMRAYRSYYLQERISDEREQAYRAAQTGFERFRAGEQVRKFEREQLQQACVVLATVATLGREDLRELQSDVVINDEGAQTLETGLIQALREKTKMLVAIGDKNQLPGYTEFAEEQRERYEPGARRHKLNWSLLHSCPYENQAFHGVTLIAQYRSHEKIGRWLSGFYEFQLEHRASNSSDYLSRLEVVDGTKMDDSRVAMVSCVHEDTTTDGERIRDSARVSDTEVWMVMRIVLKIVRECRRIGRTGLSVLIVTPYHEQLQILEAAVRGAIRRQWEDILNIRITTIDSSQGSEASVAIVSMTRVDSLGFLADNKPRTLVSLSRARDYLFVLAHKPTFKTDPWWRSLYAGAQELGVIQADDTTYLDEARKQCSDGRLHRSLCAP